MQKTYVLLATGLMLVVAFLAGRSSFNPTASRETTVALPEVRPGRSLRGDLGADGTRKTSSDPSRKSASDQIQRSPADEAKMALNHPLDTKRLEHWMKFLATMRPEDAPSIHAFLLSEAEAGREFKAENSAFWQTWANLNPSGAWTFLQENPFPSGLQGAEAIMKTWALIDPQSAITAIEDLGDSPLTKTAYAGLLQGWSQSDPAATMDFVANRLPSNLQEFAATHITGSMIQQRGYQEAQAWFDSLPEETMPGFQKESARVMLESLTKLGPQDVEKFALERFDQRWSSRRDEQHYVAQMIHRSGGSPWEYISTAIRLAPYNEDLISLPRYSAQRQPGQAMAWINENPDNPAVDVIRAGTALALYRTGNSETAEELLTQIKDPELVEMVVQAP